MFLGIDVSTYLEQQKLTKQKYFKNGKEIDPFIEFKKNGVSHIRVRVWNNPYDEEGNPYLGGTCDIDHLINLYHALKKYDFRYLVDFHYSDFWADPAKQFIPKAWRGYSLDELVKVVYDFTKECLIKAKDAGIPIDYIQIGNEITLGMLYPIAQLKGGEERKASFKRLTTLLKSGIKAAREICPEAEIIIHLESSYNIPIFREYLTELAANDVDFDILGTSYYPFWHHGFDEYFACQDMVRNEFHKRVMNVELGYTWTLEDYRKDLDEREKHLVINADNMQELIKNLPFPPTIEGQRLFMHEFIKQAKEHELMGAFYWEPLWVPGEGICWASKKAQEYQEDTRKDPRNEWANQCLFDYDANALPAFDEYKI